MSGSRSYTGLTPGAQRTVARCRRMAAEFAQSDCWAACLLLTLLQDESLASACLRTLGITPQWILHSQLGVDRTGLAAWSADAEVELDPADEEIFAGDGCQPVPNRLDGINDPLEFTRVLDRATELARRGLSDGGVSSANLLLAVVETNGAIRDRFAAVGVTIQRIQAELYPEQFGQQAPLSVDDSLLFTESPITPATNAAAPVAQMEVWRVLDACLNRAREGLRVLEDFARFLANDSQISQELKSLRHELVAAEKSLYQHSASGTLAGSVLKQRDTLGDVGTTQSTAGEKSRASLGDVVTANSRRVQESLRSLEEFGKLVSADFGSRMKQLRYRSYTVEKMLAPLLLSEAIPQSFEPAESVAWAASTVERRTRLLSARLYVLITESMCRLPWKQVVEQSLAGGADVLQLREKSLNDRELLARARWVRDACDRAGSLFIMNDRPDLAVASEADGLHIGQEEFTVAEARRILHPSQLIGVSTHDISQASQAVQDEADYLGVGPVFPSHTKSFTDFPGLSFVSEVSSQIDRPWFAIGGVTLPLLSSLIDAGAARVAVTSAIAGSECPRDLASAFKARLNAVSSEIQTTPWNSLP